MFGPLLRVFFGKRYERVGWGEQWFFFCKQPESDTLPWEYFETVMEEQGCCWRRRAWENSLGASYERALEGQ